MSWSVTRKCHNTEFDANLRGAVQEAKSQAAGTGGSPSAWANIDASANALTELHKSFPLNGDLEFSIRGHRDDVGFGQVQVGIKSVEREDQKLAVRAEAAPEPKPEVEEPVGGG